MSQRLGMQIRRRRETKGWSQRELARRVRVTHGYVAQLEGGLRHSPSLRVLRRLARALGVPVAALLR
jgi:transcriptional regulator with XRE-family HTH domain